MSAYYKIQYTYIYDSNVLTVENKYVEIIYYKSKKNKKKEKKKTRKHFQTQPFQCFSQTFI
jgi:hypothetical protein